MQGDTLSVQRGERERETEKMRATKVRNTSEHEEAEREGGFER